MYLMSFYGMELWYPNLTKSNLYKMSVGYHKAVKRLVGLNVWDGNHDACAVAEVPIFKHLFARRLISFFINLLRSFQVLYSL